MWMAAVTPENWCVLQTVNILPVLSFSIFYSVTMDLTEIVDHESSIVYK